MAQRVAVNHNILTSRLNVTIINILIRYYPTIPPAEEVPARIEPQNNPGGLLEWWASMGACGDRPTVYILHSWGPGGMHAEGWHHQSMTAMKVARSEVCNKEFAKSPAYVWYCLCKQNARVLSYGDACRKWTILSLPKRVLALPFSKNLWPPGVTRAVEIPATNPDSDDPGHDELVLSLLL